jgi:RNA polymerase sigma-70 factor (ECF subfamily)
VGAPTDQTLVAQTLNGDQEAFGILAERYYRTLWVLAYQKTGNRSDAEDLVQEALVRAFRALPSLRDPTRFASWVYNITLKLCIDWIRRRRRRDSTVALEEDQLKPKESGRFGRLQGQIGDELEQAEEHERVLEAIGELPDKYRLVITLRFVKRLSYKEIAEHLDEPAGTVANRLHRATRMLQQRLQVHAPSVAEEGR